MGYDSCMEENSSNTKEKNFQMTYIPPETGFRMEFVTMKHNTKPHWHREVEILYILNGSASVLMGGEKITVSPLEFIVIDSAIVHEIIYQLPQTMGISIHLSKGYYKRYIPEMELLRFSCEIDRLTEEQKEPYMRMCESMKDLTVLYFEEDLSTPLKNASLILKIAADLVEYFSEKIPTDKLARDPNQLARVQEVFQYVQDHFSEPLELQDVADEIGLNKEYFCRFFKKNTGMSFLHYLNQVRLNHVYQDLLYTEGSIQEILEKNGITNQKLFYRQFKDTYHCSPRELRRLSKDNPYM